MLKHFPLIYDAGKINSGLIFVIRLGLFYLLDYVTPAEIFQIGDRKKKKKKKRTGDI